MSTCDEAVPVQYVGHIGGVAEYGWGSEGVRTLSHSPSRSSLSSLLASLLSRRSCFSISELIRLASFASSLRQQAIMESKVITAWKARLTGGGCRGGGSSRAAPRTVSVEWSRAWKFATRWSCRWGATPSEVHGGVPKAWRCSGQEPLSNVEGLTAKSAVLCKSSGCSHRWLFSEMCHVTCPQTSQVTPDTTNKHFITCDSCWKLVPWKLD